MLDALKALGLRSEVSSEMFLDAARYLDSLKTTPEKDVDRASLLLEKLDEVATQGALKLLAFSGCSLLGKQLLVQSSFLSAHAILTACRIASYGEVLK